LLIQVGSDECLLSDATRLAEKARDAGVPVTLEVWDHMQHEWQFAASFLPEGKQAITSIGEFMASAFSRPT
jgi:acetyl esterase/lipase